MTDVCGFTEADRRRTFWSTQPDACDSGVDHCGNPCKGAGLLLTLGCDPEVYRTSCGDTPNLDAPCNPASDCAVPRAIETKEWVRGIALNMLLTDRRLPNTCRGWRPGSMKGHWSESFNTGGKPIGTRLRQIPARWSVAALKALVKAEVEETLSKLTAYGVATSIDVEVNYTGGMSYAVSATIWGTDGTSTNVGVSAKSDGETISWAA